MMNVREVILVVSLASAMLPASALVATSLVGASSVVMARLKVRKAEQGNPVSVVSPLTGTVFYHSDHLGSATVLTDAQGRVVERVAYYPYGSERARTGESAVAHRFTGQELDADTGLYDYGARFYDPVVARFISVDPLVNAPEAQRQTPSHWLSPFLYASANPLKYVDPTGMAGEQPAKTETPGKYPAQTVNQSLPPQTQSMNLKIKKDVDRSVLTDEVLNRVQDAMSRAHIDSATITSTKRTPREQAAAQLTNVRKNGLGSERALYRYLPPALTALDVYTQLKAQGVSPQDFPGLYTEAMTGPIALDPEAFDHLRAMTDRVTVDIGPNSLHSEQLNLQCQCSMAPQGLAQHFARELAREPGIVRSVLSPPVDTSIHFTMMK